MYLVFSAEFLAKESPQVGTPNLHVLDKRKIWETDFA